MRVGGVGSADTTSHVALDHVPPTRREYFGLADVQMELHAD